MAIISLIFTLFVTSCSRGVSQEVKIDDQNEQNWQKLCIQKLNVEHAKYKKSFDETCPYKRDLKFDYDRKQRSIEEFPIKIFMNKLYSELSKSSIKFDSIIGINKFQHDWDEVEYPTKQILFLIFDKGKIEKRYQVDLYNNETKIYKETEVLDKHYLELMRRKNGCNDVSLLVITSFYNNTINIRKMVINPEKLMFLDPEKAPHD